MRKGLIYLAGAAITAIAGIALSQPASAVPIVANGSLTFTPSSGFVTVNSTFAGCTNVGGCIAADTTAKTEPGQGGNPGALAVDSVTPNLSAAIAVGNTVTVSGVSVPLAPALTTQPISLTLTIGGQIFTFTSETTTVRSATTTTLGGTISETYNGTLTTSLGNVFILGAPVTWSESCTQAGLGAQINCANSVLALGTATVPEPASLAILGASLLGFGALGRRRFKA